MLLLLITDLRWNIPGQAQNVESTGENKQPQCFVTSYSCNILQQFTCFLISAQLSFLACCAAMRASHLLSRAESLTAKAFPVPHSVVALHVETVTEGVRKAARSWDKESKQHCSSCSIKLWGRFFWSHFSSWKTCCSTLFDSFLRNSCKPFCRGQFIFASTDERYYWISNVDCKFKFWWTVSAICSTNKHPLIAESNRALSYLLLCCYNCLHRNTNTTYISLVI